MMAIRSKGFTIIEVMLFLAISGLLVATLLGGWTVLINTQRYKDSIDTMYGYFQDQYNLVYNVENERSNGLTCTDSGTIQSGGAGTDSRGQSNCVLIGRYIKLTNGTDIESFAVIGHKPSTPPSRSDDASIIRAYEPTVVTQSIGLTESSQVVPWGAIMKGKQGMSNPLNLGIMMLRTPENTGTVHTYVTTLANSSDVTKIEPSQITTENEKSDTTFCFDAGTPTFGTTQAVVLRKFASSRSSVETLGSDNGC